MKPKVIVIGAAGKMGKNVICAIKESNELELIGAIECKEHPLIGADCGEIAGIGKNNIPITDNLENIIENSDVTIDFTTPKSSISNLKINEKYKKPAVIGTTGFSNEEKNIIEEISKNIPVLLSPNMSLGVNLLFKLTEIAAKKLGAEYDVEIIEAHHKLKKDAPSGTALKLKDIITKERDITKIIYGREGIIGERTKDEIGIFAIRAGDIVGEHTVIFATNGERIELTHKASSRMTFAKGAVKAAFFIIKKTNGLYSMADVLDLTS